MTEVIQPTPTEQAKAQLQANINAIVTHFDTLCAINEGKDMTIRNQQRWIIADTDQHAKRITAACAGCLLAGMAIGWAVAIFLRPILDAH